jgi:hypothetical protein
MIHVKQSNDELHNLRALQFPFAPATAVTPPARDGQAQQAVQVIQLPMPSQLPNPVMQPVILFPAGPAPSPYSWPPVSAFPTQPPAMHQQFYYYPYPAY